MPILIQVMKRRKFNLKNVNNFEKSFMFMEENENEIVVDVDQNGQYHLYYSNPTMIGFMDSGILDDIWDDKSFQYNYLLFKMQVEQLKGFTLYG